MKEIMNYFSLLLKKLYILKIQISLKVDTFFLMEIERKCSSKEFQTQLED